MGTRKKSKKNKKKRYVFRKTNITILNGWKAQYSNVWLFKKNTLSLITKCPERRYYNFINNNAPDARHPYPFPAHFVALFFPLGCLGLPAYRETASSRLPVWENIFHRLWLPRKEYIIECRMEFRFCPLKKSIQISDGLNKWKRARTIHRCPDNYRWNVQKLERHKVAKTLHAIVLGCWRFSSGFSLSKDFFFLLLVLRWYPNMISLRFVHSNAGV